jgi:hypothetical protein
MYQKTQYKVFRVRFLKKEEWRVLRLFFKYIQVFTPHPGAHDEKYGA